MKILIKKEHNFIELDTNKLKKLGEGLEAKVYKYKDIAIKIHHNYNLKKGIGLSIEEVNEFMCIPTKRILMPLNPIYNKTSYIGYSTKLITNIKQTSDLIYLGSNILYGELDKLMKDSKILSDNKVMLLDLSNDKNLVFNGNLYFVDPGNYYIDKTATSSYIYNENMEEISISLYKNLFCFNGTFEYIEKELKIMDGINSENIDLMVLSLIDFIYKKDYENNFLISGKKNYLEYLMHILEKYESISKYKNKIINDYVNDPNISPQYARYVKKIIK